MKKLLSLIIINLLVGLLMAQDKSMIIDEFASRLMDEFTEVPGLALSVVRGDEVLLSTGYGYADKERNISTTEHTSFYIASITKSYVGLLALILEEEGKINLDQPLTTYKPFNRLKNKGIFKEVTIRKLLNHTSGLENGYITYRDAFTGDKSKEIMEMLLEEKTTLKKEGQIYDYDNLGFNILDILIKAELGNDWRELLEEKIFRPTGMTHSSAFISKAERSNWELAWPYDGFYSKYPERNYLMKNDSMMQAAGGIITSANDAAIWIELFLNGGKINGRQIISSDLIAEALNPTAVYQRDIGIFQDSGYGVGWITSSFKDLSVNYHLGGFAGFFSHVSIMPTQKIGIAAFANESAFGDNLANLIVSFSYDLLTGKIQSIDDYAKEVEDLRKLVASVHVRAEQYKQKLLTREWKLKKPKSAYEGVYYNKFLGTVLIRKKNDELIISMGPLKAEATAFPKPNSIRIDFGFGGNVGYFKMKKGKAVKLISNGEVFNRIN